MRAFILRFSGVWMGAEMILVAETKQKAFNDALRILKEEKDYKGTPLYEKNKDLTKDDLSEIDLTKRHAYLLSNGDY